MDQDFSPPAPEESSVPHVHAGGSDVAMFAAVSLALRELQGGAGPLDSNGVTGRGTHSRRLRKDDLVVQKTFDRFDDAAAAATVRSSAKDEHDPR
jgi:hypothetical protein